MNFLQLVQRLHSESLRSTAPPTSVVGATDRNQRLVNWIADAWRELQSEQTKYDWRWIRGTTDDPLTVGQQTYTGADLNIANFGRWRPSDSTYSPYCYIPGLPNAPFQMEFFQLDLFRYHFVYRTVGSTVPVAYSIDEDNQLLIGPKPSQAFNIRIEYVKEPWELTNDADVPDMPTRFHMLLVWRALQEVGKSDAAPETLVRANDNYAIMKNQLLLDQGRLPHL